ncbi:MAG: 2-hydroxyglutaryl-CoA dehydratase [Proteobacteria bacterium]|nr:2-hydroxyglutaryl-CoA dehydratase [Pseudomonadota bacterium]MBU1389043.1 2-hydroxyglutaryl-CoA dehydratase [Pseudomonadota bacterium]MBU1543595.1 2-hydroxyglutaryl-CoA dehydratase [Pseudomonadota bacterium]MBU2481946.1 2-hydroxyglutaryl-CoA dehydratase [Pseudomonadota bacterium]
MFIGIDIGSRTAKGILFDGKKIIATAICDTGIFPRRSGESLFQELIEKAGLAQKDIKKTVGTGYGRVSLTLADKTITELSCHAKGAHFSCPSARTVIDIGGQDSKVIRIDQSGSMKDFTMNDKCAAGTGRFFEIAASALEMDMETFCDIRPVSEPFCQISNMCAVFAETEIISLLAKEISVESIAAGINLTFSKRICAMAKRIGISNDVLFVGGVAKNSAVKNALARALDIQFHPFEIDPQLMGALGASIFASEL